MNLFTKRFGLVLAGVVGVGAIAALAIGASFALFTSSVPGTTRTFTAGTVNLNNPANGTCATPNNLEPGDSGTCAFTVHYAGSLDAYVGATVAYASGSGAFFSELQFAINDSAGHSMPANGATPVLIGSGGKGTYTATLIYHLPSNAGNAYQGLSASLRLTFYAVQCSNNGLLEDGTLDTGTNASCGDPSPASWTQTPANAPANSNFTVPVGGGLTEWSTNPVAAGGSTTLTIQSQQGYETDYPDATTTITWPSGDLTFTGNGDTGATCTSNAGSITCSYNGDFAHPSNSLGTFNYKGDHFNFTVSSSVTGTFSVNITVTGFGGSSKPATATATIPLRVN